MFSLLAVIPCSPPVVVVKPRYRPLPENAIPEVPVAPDTTVCRLPFERTRTTLLRPPSATYTPAPRNAMLNGAASWLDQSLGTGMVGAAEALAVAASSVAAEAAPSAASSG